MRVALPIDQRRRSPVVYMNTLISEEMEYTPKRVEACPLHTLIKKAGGIRRRLFLFLRFSDQATESLSAFRAMARTLVDAGFALIMISSPVNGLIPLRALRAGLITRRSLIPSEGTVNSPEPFFFR